MMERRVVVCLSAAILALSAVRVEAQDNNKWNIKPPTVEIGGFGRYAFFADTAGLDPGFAGGGRLGIFFHKNWSVEGEWSSGVSDVAEGFPTGAGDTLTTVSIPAWQARLLYGLPLNKSLQLLLGAGWMWNGYGRVRAVAPRTNGPSGLIGLRIRANKWLSVRVEGYGQYALSTDDDAQPYAQDGTFNWGIQAGLSALLFVGKKTVVDTVVRTETVTQVVKSIDTVYVDRITGPMKAGTVVIGVVNFDFDKSTISSDADKILSVIAASLKENPDVRIEVVGFTDAIGSQQYNLGLSERRAKAVSGFLGDKGVSGQIANVRWDGKNDPVASNTNPEGRATNRRVLITRVQ